MNKKLMAVAVAGALAAPAVAFAQASNVTIYGRANLGLDSYQAKGATAGSTSDWDNRVRVFDNGSRLGVRGEENLGGGLKAMFLIENGIAMDTGNGNGQNGAANGSVGLAARVAYVGIQGSWGSIAFGKNNVWWGNGQNEQWQANYGTVGNQFFTGGAGRGMGIGVNRTANVMQYNSPVWNGVNFVAAYSPSAQELAAAGTHADGRLMALTVQGTHANRIVWGWDFAESRANTPANASEGQTSANKFRAGWLYQPGANVSLFYIAMENENGGGVNSATGLPLPPPSATGLPVDGAAGIAASRRFKVDGWGIVWEHMWGNFGVEANYSKQGDITGCNVASVCADTGNTTYFLGARYLLSKRTSVMAYYLQYKNERQNNSDMPAGGMSSVAGGLAQGADPRAYGVGIQHNF